MFFFSPEMLKNTHLQFTMNKELRLKSRCISEFVTDFVLVPEI
jgi:hypothetical protein